MLRDLTTIIFDRCLTTEEIDQVAAELLDPSVPEELKVGFLGAWARRGESAEELAKCAEALLPQARDPGVYGNWQGRPLFDCCGTGGGGLNLLNISTGLMFILGALGIPVVKHGNRGITKKSGSADVLEALGVKIDLAPELVSHCLEKVGCAFLFAPAYHPSFAVVSPVRRKLATQGQRTVFNLLGPLLNPARPEARLIGVFTWEHVTLYRNALAQMGCPRFTVACGQDAESGRRLGEVSSQGKTILGSTLKSANGEPLTEFIQKSHPDTSHKIDSLLVESAADSAQRIVAILSGEESQGFGREMLLINAAMASWTQGTATSLEEGLAQSTEALDSGRAFNQLIRWQEFSQQNNS